MGNDDRYLSVVFLFVNKPGISPTSDAFNTARASFLHRVPHFMALATVFPSAETYGGCAHATAPLLYAFRDLKLPEKEKADELKRGFALPQPSAGCDV